MSVTCPTCNIKRNTPEAPECPVCLYKEKPKVEKESFYPKLTTADAPLNQFPPEIFEERYNRKNKALHSEIGTTLHDTYGWTFDRIAPLFGYKSRNSISELYRL